MKRFVNRLTACLGLASGTGRAPARVPPRARIGVEALEDRRLMSVTDMTSLAQLFPRHSGPTVLYLNFDGNSSQGVSSFQSTTGNRSQDIHDILFRTAQIFAPFDVQVRRLYGDGNYSNSNGNTTIFIGDKSGNGTGTNNKAYAYTPWASVDYPGDKKGIHHQPNSDTYDQAFVDPISWNGSMNVSWNNRTIARAIAHEAGHTFGLAHVLSSPAPEVMSYDASNTRFVNQTFDITDLNFNGTELVNDSALIPKWHQTIQIGWFKIDLPVNIVTQNSYTYLQAVLGPRVTSGDISNVADTTAVDASYVDGHAYGITTGTNVTAYLQQTGDWDVFNLKTAVSKKIILNVKRPSGSSVDPVVMIYNSSGQNLLAFNDDGGGFPHSRIVFQTTAGQTYKVVVGAYGQNSSGAYQLTVGNYFDVTTVKYTTLLKTVTNTTPTSQLYTSLISGMSSLTGSAPVIQQLSKAKKAAGHGHAGQPAGMPRLPGHLAGKLRALLGSNGHGGDEDHAFLSRLGQRLAKKNDALYPHLNSAVQHGEEEVFSHC